MSHPRVFLFHTHKHTHTEGFEGRCVGTEGKSLEKSIQHTDRLPLKCSYQEAMRTSVCDCLLQEVSQHYHWGSTEARATSRPSISTCHWPATQWRLTRPWAVHAPTQTHSHFLFMLSHTSTAVSSLIVSEALRSKVWTAVASLDDKSLAEG